LMFLRAFIRSVMKGRGSASTTRPRRMRS
jgi:hypothetical protein